MYGANETMETFRKNAGQIFIHMLRPRSKSIARLSLPLQNIAVDQRLGTSPTYVGGGAFLRVVQGTP
jgi:hypothetical protein